MKVQDAYKFIVSRLLTDVGRFYGSHAGLSLGAGLIFRGVRVPLYNEERNVFMTVASTVYVMTHECDVAQENVRPLNDDVLVCPLMALEQFVPIYEQRYAESGLKSFLDNVAKRNVYRLMYFPCLRGTFDYGAMLYLNAISSTKVTAFNLPNVSVTGAVSEWGLREVDFLLENHFLRPKDERLAFGA
jgi:hypothetical protein